MGGKAGKGEVGVGGEMCEGGWAAGDRKKDYFAGEFGRIAARRGKKRGLLAVAHSLLVAAYEMLKHKEHYREFGADFFEGLNKDQVKRRLVQRLAKLGFQVTVTQTPTAE